MDPFKFYNDVGWKERKNITTDATLFEDLRTAAKRYVSSCRKKINNHIPLKGLHILDFASGPLQYKEYLSYSKNFKYRHCVDFSKQAINEAKNKLGAKGKYYCNDFLKVNFKNNYFDSVISLHTIYHMPKQKQARAIRKMLSIVREDSNVVIVYSNPNSIVNKIKKVLFLENVNKRKISDLYFFCYNLDWWKQFVNKAEVKFYPWRSFSSQHQKVLFPNNKFGKILFNILLFLENTFPNFFVKNFQYYTVVLKKKLTIEKKNIAFVIAEGFTWKGEENYFKCLLSSIDNSTIHKIYLFSGISNKKTFEDLRFKNIKIVYTNLFEKGTFLNLLRKTGTKIFGKYNPILNFYFKFHKIDVLSHTIPLFNFKNILWFTDFQHFFLDKNFSNKEILRRDKLFTNYIKNGNSLVVSSKDSRNHLNLFAKKNKLNLEEKPKVLNFVPNINFSQIKNITYLSYKYNINKNYIFIPNQFWIHKNHKIILDTIQLLKKKKFYAQFVFTGSRDSAKNQDHFENILRHVKNNEINDYFKYLGMINYNDLLSLTCNCKLFINPSLFEGWSTTVEEAKIFKKKIILSDIKVHKEQGDENTFFFNPYRADELANIITSNFNKKNQEKKLKDLEKNYFINKEKFKENYFNIVNNCA